jgi:hypothetical protein
MVIIKSPDAEMIDKNNISFFMTMKILFVKTSWLSFKIQPSSMIFHRFQNRIAVTNSMTANGYGLAMWRYLKIVSP